MQSSTLLAVVVFQSCSLAVLSNVNGRSSPPRPLIAASWVRTKDIRHDLQEVLDLALGEGPSHITDVRLNLLKTQLEPLFDALPKNEKGLLGHSTVRYALHRHFVHQHAMYVKGLEPAGESWSEASAVDILEDKVPSYVQHLFEERLHAEGFGLHELALLAATLEHFIHSEAKERLAMAYRLTGHEFGLEEPVSTLVLEKVLDLYMSMFISGQIHRQMTDEQLAKLIHDTPDLFPNWSETQTWLRTVQEEVLMNQGVTQDLVSFDQAHKVVQAITERFGRFQDQECREMTKLLNRKEHKGTGRMPLRSFYEAGWQFAEKKEYLDQLGAIDWTFQKDQPMVVIPNYVMSLTNCLASSSMYSVCCIDPCEDILRHLEAKAGAPSATPEDLVKYVSETPSATVRVPRGLTQSLVNHLGEIAELHQGRVPLHGRLFSQWLHHAYPRECVFPRVAGTAQPLSAEDWMATHNATSTAVSRAELQAILAEAVQVKDLADGDMEETLPWDAQEELVFHHKKPTLAHEFGVLFRALACCGMAFGFVSMMMQSAQSLPLRNGDAKDCKAMV